MIQENKRATTDLDHHLGERIKLARAIAGISQASLAESINVTFQQIQKYEKGSNRIPASRLYHIAKTLNQDIHFFFSGADSSEKKSDSEHEDEHIALVKAYSKITNNSERKVILEMIKSFKKN